MRAGVLRTSVGFRWYWVGQSVSAFGDQVSRIAIPLIAVAALHATATQMGVLSSAGQVSLLVFGLFAGAWVDRARRRRLLIACDVTRAAVIAAIPCAAAVGMLSVPLLIGVTFAVGSLGVIFSTAVVAFLPSLIEPNRLIEGNARLMQTNAVAQISGPGLGGLMVQLLSAPFAIVADAFSYLVSAACLIRAGAKERSIPAERREPFGRSIAEGLTFVCRHPLLRPSAGCAGTYNLFNAAITTLQVLYLARTLHLRPVSIGLVLGAIGPGALLGAAMAVRASARFGLGRTMIGGLMLAGSANLAFASTPELGTAAPLLLAAAMFGNGLGQPLYNVNQSSLRQAVVPTRKQGRVTATLFVLAGGAAPLGALAAGGSATALGIRTTLIAAAAGTVLSSGWLLLSPVRRLTDVSDLFARASPSLSRQQAEPL